MAGDVRVPINSDADIVTARQQGRSLAARVGFGNSELTLIATAISEVARNIVEYAGRGEVILSLTEGSNSPGIVVVARDQGPGIPDSSKPCAMGIRRTAVWAWAYPEPGG